MDAAFWMGGRLATGLEEISSDIESLNQPGFRAVIGSFENQWTITKFSKVVDAQLPKTLAEWKPIAASTWQSSLSQSEYCEYVTRIKQRIESGDVYQVNACRILETDNHENTNLLALAHKIAEGNPSPFASYFSLPGLEIASASPERFISLRNGIVVSSPIKGTSANENFLEKDRAENLMIVDLIRNDMSSTAKTGSVTTPRLFATEKHPGLFHLVSDVRSELAEGETIVTLLRAMMPPGSVSGAPKSSALRIISDNEGERGPYCGAIGWVENGQAEIAVGIRTFWQKNGILKFGTGAGITWGSDPQSEWEETELKAHRLIGLTSK